MYYIVHAFDYIFVLYLTITIKKSKMKKVFVSQENPVVEFIKNSFYSFQVLIVGVAIPALFFIGIANNKTKKTVETESPIVHQVSGVTPLPAQKIIGFHMLWI